MDVDELFDAWERAWSGRDTRAFEAICARDLHYEDPFTPEPLLGVRALRRHARKLWNAVPDARVNSTGVRMANRFGPETAVRVRRSWRVTHGIELP